MEMLNFAPTPAPPESLFFGPPWLYMFLLFCKRTQKCPFDFVGGIKSAAAVRWVRNLNLPGNHATNRGTIQVLSGLCFSFFIQRTCRVKKSNPAAEPHGSPPGASASPIRPAGLCRWGGGGGGVFIVSLLLEFRNLLRQTMKTNA